MSDFVDFNLAKKLKEKGFKEDCLAHFTFEDDITYNINSDIVGRRLLYCCNDDTSIWANGLIDAPTISQVLKWLREEKNLSVEPYSCACGWRVTICKTGDVLDGYASGGTCVKNEVEGYNDGGAFNLYEEAAIAGIEYVLDNLI